MKLYFEDNNELRVAYLVPSMHYDLALKLAKIGLEIWYEASEENPQPMAGFTSEEIKDFYWSGHCEPIEELFKRNCIPFHEMSEEAQEKEEPMYI